MDNLYESKAIHIIAIYLSANNKQLRDEDTVAQLVRKLRNLPPYFLLH